MPSQPEAKTAVVEPPGKRISALLEKPPQETAKKLPSLIADLRFDKIDYSEADSVVQLIEGFCSNNRDKLVAKSRGFGKEFWRTGETPFFSEDQKQDKDYIQTYEGIQKLAEVGAGLRAYKGWIADHPEALEEPGLGYEDIIYRFVAGGESGHLRIDLEKRHVYTRDGQIADHLLAQEARNAGQLKIDAESFENLKLDPITLKYGNQIQLNPKISRPDPDRIGRVYISPSIGDYLHRSNVITIFEYFARQFNDKPDLYHSMKVLDFAERLKAVFNSGEITDQVQGDLNRSDKIVIYFDMDNFGGVLTGLQKQYENLYEPHQLLNTDHPLFSTTLPNNPEAINNRHYRSMYGISFAEDPKEIVGEKQRSRNATVAEILRRATKQVGIENINNEEFDEAVRKQFEYFKIDPDNPAFNLHEKGDDNNRIAADPTDLREHEKRWRSLQTIS